MVIVVCVVLTNNSIQKEESIKIRCGIKRVIANSWVYTQQNAERFDRNFTTSIFRGTILPSK